MQCYKSRGPERSNFLFSCYGDVRLLAEAKKRLSAYVLIEKINSNMGYNHSDVWI